MAEKERLIEELESYEPYAACFPHLTIDGKLVLDVLNFLRNSKPRELTKDEWKHWKKAKYRDPICMIYKQDDTRTPIWVMKPEAVHEPAYLMGEIKLFTGKPDRKDVKWNERNNNNTLCIRNCGSCLHNWSYCHSLSGKENE